VFISCNENILYSESSDMSSKPKTVEPTMSSKPDQSDDSAIVFFKQLREKHKKRQTKFISIDSPDYIQVKKAGSKLRRNKAKAEAV
jgi:hypothetical protein